MEYWKLIELLNEYEDLSDAEECEKWCIDEYDRISEWWRRSQWTNNWICSKNFGFIKWLVDNDKIDRDKNVLAFEFSSVYTYDGENYEDHIKECKLLMLLAIQSEPLKFLISILK